jgi:hypothetical protein
MIITSSLSASGCQSAKRPNYSLLALRLKSAEESMKCDPLHPTISVPPLQTQVTQTQDQVVFKYRFDLFWLSFLVPFKIFSF